MNISAAIAFIVLGLAMAPLRAQMFSPEFEETPIAKFTDKDLSLLQSATRDALNDGADGATVTWRNPDTGASGSLTPLRTTHSEQHECRLMRVINHAKGLSEDSQFWFCQMPDGTWKTGIPSDDHG